MKKPIIFIILISIIALTFTGCANNGDNVTEAAKEAEYQWKFAHEENNGSIQDVYAKEFKRVLEEKSDGRIHLDIYPVGQIGDATQQAELLQYGGIEFANISPGNTGTIVPENQLFSLHFLFSEDMEVNKEILEESKALNELLSEKYLEKNIKILSYWTEGAMEWTTSKEANTPDKWKGLKFRTMPSPMIVASYKAYGANPTPLPYMEVYSALQLNMIQGQENPISAIEEMKFHEVQDYFILGSSSIYATTTAVNPEFFEELPNDIKEIVLETIDELDDFAFDTQEQLNEDALEKIKESDVNVIELTSEEREEFRKEAEKAYQLYIDETGEDGEEILNTLMKEVENASK
ncbi:MAG TPA: DctP family TRAP transporter solute-binding subunit [Tissierellaceae bacterium]|nr:DctP family TRAP transporter solute-binding subunit [Tissierellaceae bacterium]